MLAGEWLLTLSPLFDHGVLIDNDMYQLGIYHHYQHHGCYDRVGLRYRCTVRDYRQL